jgi:hypothetical protein
MKLTLLSTLVASTAAFAPVSQKGAATSTNLKAAMVGGGGNGSPELKIVAGKGEGEIFDPWGLSKANPEWMPWFREAELKHGRQAMLATVGFVAPEFVRVPGDMFSVDAIPSSVEAHNELVGTSLLHLLFWIGLAEACTFPALANMNAYDREPGDFSFDPLGLKPKDAAKLEQMKLKELKNGRLAMIAIGGMVTQAAITGHGFPYM